MITSFVRLLADGVDRPDDAWEYQRGSKSRITKAGAGLRCHGDGNRTDGAKAGSGVVYFNFHTGAADELLLGGVKGRGSARLINSSRGRKPAEKLRFFSPPVHQQPNGE